MNRSPMPPPSRPMRQISAKRLDALGGFAVSTFVPKRPQPAVPPARRKTLAERSEGWCEAQFEDCQGRATDPHHRITRKDGGRKGEAKERSDRLSNLLDLCRHCHNQVHQFPARSFRRRHGWLLRESTEPTQSPVRRRGRLVYLDDNGDVHEYEAHCA